MHARRIARQHHAQGLRPREETERAPLHLAVPPIQNAQVQIARQAAEHALRLGERPANLLHVAPRQHVGQPRRRRHLLDVLLGRLPLVTNRQLVGRENLRRLDGHFDEFGDTKFRQRRARPSLLRQIAPDQSGVRLTDLHERLARAVVHDAHHVQTFIRLASAQNGYVQHIFQLRIAECGMRIRKRDGD
jgi:hypothetical protein